MVVDENKRKIITAVETGGAYESEIEMLREDEYKTSFEEAV
jgi:hypothetical protein